MDEKEAHMTWKETKLTIVDVRSYQTLKFQSKISNAIPLTGNEMRSPLKELVQNVFSPNISNI